MLKRSTLTAILVLASMVTVSRSCFPVQMFKETFRWLQSVSLHSRWYMYVTQFEPSEINMESEGLDSQRKIKMTCIRPQAEMTYLVQLNENQKIKYQCIRFQSLSKFVVRLLKTKLRDRPHEMNCYTDQYTEDDAVLFANEVSPESCPLVGGYQLILHQSEAVGPNCLDTVQSYNPKLQFECDVAGGGGVRAEFGPMCEPPVLTASQKMRRRRTTKLYCLGSWEEAAGYSSVLMRMENAPLTTWCLLYKKKSGKKGQQSDDFYSAFLSLDGKCSSQAFADIGLTSNSSMYGFMARYSPGDDPKCTEDSYLQSCQSKEDDCLAPSQCPNKCERCVEPVKKEMCFFDSETFGDYQLVGSSEENFNVTISQMSINGTTFGEFECRGFAESGIPGRVYPVFQSGTSDTCMPHYACAQVTPLTTGVIAFNLRSAVRNENTGHPLSCWETHSKLGNIYPVFLQRTITLLDRTQLGEVPCQVERNTYPSMGGCRLVVEKCTGDCSTMRVGYDQLSCPRTSSNPYNIELKHTCYAKLKFKKVHAILAKSNDVGRDLCWVFYPGKGKLFITKAENCNEEAIDKIIENPESVIKNDPINAISQPISGSGGRYEIVGASHSRSWKLELNHFLFLIVILSMCL